MWCYGLQNDPRRLEFSDKLNEYMEKLIEYVPVDDIMDQIAVENVHSSLPPCLTEGTYRVAALQSMYWQ